MGYYDHEDFAFTMEGDLVITFDPLETGEDLGWDFMKASRLARDIRREELETPGSHPNNDTLTLADFYIEALSKVYPRASVDELRSMIRVWGYEPDDYYESLRQTIRDRCKTTNEDWATYPEVGADMEECIGDTLGIVTAETLRQKIIRAITYDGLVQTAHMQVKYVTADARTLLFVIEVLVGYNIVVRVVVPFSFVEGPYLMLKEEDNAGTILT